jgi:hypothetical protein
MGILGGLLFLALLLVGSLVSATRALRATARAQREENFQKQPHLHKA